jgi:hypothetical protein
MSHCGAQGNSDAALRSGSGAAGAGVTGRAAGAVPLMRLVPPRGRARGRGRGKDASAEAGPGNAGPRHAAEPGPSLQRSRTHGASMSWERHRCGIDVVPQARAGDRRVKASDRRGYRDGCGSRDLG